MGFTGNVGVYGPSYLNNLMDHWGSDDSDYRFLHSMHCLPSAAAILLLHVNQS